MGILRGMVFLFGHKQGTSNSTGRTVYEIPYCYGNVSHNKTGNFVTTNVTRKWPKTSASSTIVIETDEPTGWRPRTVFDRPMGPNSKIETKNFLGARGPHPPWQLHSARLLHLDDSLVTAAGLPEPEGTPHVMYSKEFQSASGGQKKYN
ncbi:MAG: hypothetical protein Ct9H90mP5_06550 [Acidimicrobiaceae bacterium]|nr:MAG: hypothetical protein Ct9H90mP5_06550 [Acidimicrobiaceae bacterium]